MAQLKELTYEEKDLILPKLILLLRTKTDKDNPYLAPKIIDIINYYKEKIGFTCTFNETRLRKITNYIRDNGLAPILSTSNGYWYDKNPVAIIQIAISMENRANSIRAAAQGLRRLAQEIINEKEDPIGISF